MGLPKVAAACLLLASFATGCASLRWSMQKATRKEGSRLLEFPEAVAKQYGCSQRKLPFFAIERGEIVPPRVRAGGEFNHRLVTVLCPAEPTGVEVGRLVEAIRFRGRILDLGTRDGFEIRPGRWVFDGFVELPPDAEPGVYAYELSFESPGVSFARSWTFAVEKP